MVAPKDAPSSLAGYSRAELEALVREMGEPPYRAQQIFSWVQARGAETYDSMTNLPKDLRERLGVLVPVRGSSVEEESASEDGTRKILLRLHDGKRIECVLIPEADRRTACISTQVGCGVGCVFCASGAQGVERNLDAAEIVEQALWLTSRAQARLTHVVVMGMGEPLHNVPALKKALEILQDVQGLDLGSRRITVSTSGPRRGFEELLRSGLKVKLAISLHAPSDALRKRLVPRGGSGGIADLLGMADAWFRATGRDVTFEYVLLAGINDRDEDAAAVARLAGRHRNVNVIPMNPVSFAPQLRAPSPERVDAFVASLRARGVVVHVRRQRGDDVAAACGQLAASRR